jgi:Trypsin-like peptidase domain
MLKRRTVVLAMLASRISATLANSDPKDARMPPLTPTESMVHSTVRIECLNAAGGVSSGTGFFYNLFVSGEQSVPVIITNKHVFDGNAKATFVLTLTKADGSPDLGNLERVEISDLPGKWLGHPDPKVDLALLPIAELFRTLAAQDKKPFVAFLDQAIIPTADVLKSLTPVEDVLVVGYPDGIWDSFNNAPIFRRGITATAPYLPFNGDTEFLVDCSIFPGSSGSPVFLFNEGSYPSRNGGLVIGRRLYFLGVVHAVAQHMVSGHMIIVQAPTDTRSVPVSAIPNNLGVCVMASRVLDFEPVLVRAGFFAVPPGYQMRATLP